MRILEEAAHPIGRNGFIADSRNSSPITRHYSCEGTFPMQGLILQGDHGFSALCRNMRGEVRSSHIGVAISLPVTTDGPQPPGSSRSCLPALEISLRRPTWNDVPIIFEMVSEPAGNLMARTKPRTREVFMARWKVVLADPAINSQVIEIVRPGLAGGEGAREFAGTISVFQSAGETRNEVGYWIAQPHWGKGIASRALEMFLLEERRRPLFATASMTNIGSHGVMLRNGFRLIGRYQSEESDRLMARETAEFVLE